MLKTCESFPEGCIIFLDELDALATSRSTGVWCWLACLGAWVRSAVCCTALLALVPLLDWLSLHVHARMLAPCLLIFPLFRCGLYLPLC